MIDTRQTLSRRYLAGQGIEIGALHQPLPVPDGASVTYVDRMDVTGLRKHYPELGKVDFKCDRVDDGEKLDTFADESLDFIVANHMLEHCEDPIGTVCNHLKRLRSGGCLYYAIPARQYGFDRERPLTQWEHLLSDNEHGAEASRWEHYLQYATLVDARPSPEETLAYARHLMSHRYSIHFHVWDESTFGKFLRKLKKHLSGAFRVENFTASGSEVIAILKKA